MLSSVKTTKEGRRSFMAMVLVALAALNTGNNLIYLTVAMMAAIFTLSVVLVVMNLRGLSLSITPPRGPVFANREVSVKALVSNSKKHLPSFSVRVRGFGAASIIHQVPPGGLGETAVALKFPRRGWVRLSDFTLASSFPFIFLELSKKIRLREEFLVYPEIFDIELSSLCRGEGGAMARRWRAGDEVHYVREYRPGDDKRRISWKASARHERLMVKELALEEARKATVVLDGTGPEDPEAFERAVSIAASAADCLVRRGFHVRLVAPGAEVPFGEGREHLFRVLSCLAVTQEKAAWESDVRLPAGGTVVVLKSEKSALAQRAGEFAEVLHARRL